MSPVPAWRRILLAFAVVENDRSGKSDFVFLGQERELREGTKEKE
jgi:hypothetical protein